MQRAGRFLIAVMAMAAAAIAMGIAPARSQDNPATGRFPPGAGQPQVQAACGPCHAVTVVTMARKNAAEWERMVEVMITRGARVSDADYDVIVDYLIRNFSAPGADAAAATPRPASPNG